MGISKVIFIQYQASNNSYLTSEQIQTYYKILVCFFLPDNKLYQVIGTEVHLRLLHYFGTAVAIYWYINTNNNNY